MSAYSMYKGQSAGRIMHFIHKYCTLHFAEHCTISKNEVKMYGDLFAIVKEWVGPKQDIPIFEFMPSKRGLWDNSVFNNAQENLKFYPKEWIYHVTGKNRAFMPVPDYAEIFSLDNFIKLVKNKQITNNDGGAMLICTAIVNDHGTKEMQVMNQYVDVERLENMYPIFTHIAWFAK